MSNEIKVGDRVRLVKGPYIMGDTPWNLGTVVKHPCYTPMFPYAVEFDDDPTKDVYPSLCCSDEIEKV